MSAKKLSGTAKTRDLYISSLFKLSLKYAKSLNPDQILILSAKYGLVGLDQEINTYSLTLKSMPVAEVRNWANKVLGQLRKVADLEKDEIIFLCGERYRKHLIPFINHYQIPLKGLGIGKQLRYLKTHSLNGQLL